MKFSLDTTRSGFITATLIIVLSVLAVYSNNYANEFFFDDYYAIIDNPQIKTLSLPALLRLDPNTPISGRPISALSFALNYALGGLDVRGYHLVNNLIHLLAALALFGLVRSTLLLPRFARTYGADANRYALLAALLWALHPLLTESVTYIVARTESLMGLFYLATLFFAARGFRAEQPRPWFIAAVTTCVLGMGSKEVMVSAPLMVLLYDMFLVAGSLRGALRQRRGFYGALAASWLVLLYYQIGLPHGGGIHFNDPSLSVLDYLRTQITVIVHYLRLVFWPHPLVLDSQDWPIVRDFSPVLIWPLLLLGAMAAATIIGLRQKAWWALPGVAFFAFLAPTSSIIPLFGEIVSERRMYLPLATVIILLVFGLDTLWQRLAGRPSGRNLPPVLPLLVMVPVIIALGTLSWSRNQDYRTAVTILMDTASKRPANPRAQANLGKALLNAGRYAEALQPFTEAFRLNPIEQMPPDIYCSYASVLAHLGRTDEALLMYQKALDLDPNNPNSHYHLGNFYLLINALPKAADSFRTAIALAPDHARAHGNLGMILLQQGDLAGAEIHLQRLLELAPMDGRAYLIYGDFLTSQNRFAEAERLYRSGINKGVLPEELAGRLEALSVP